VAYYREIHDGSFETRSVDAAKLYKPIWEYDLETVAKDLSAHLVYGLSTATALRLLAAPDGPVASARR
jgi:hypothetical protein